MIKNWFYFLGFILGLLNASTTSYAQEFTIPAELKIDSSYNYIQFYDSVIGQKLANHFENVANDKVVIFHYGGSHIQAERPTTFARANFQEKYGNGGRGMIFNYGAANTYSSVNYASTFKGEWVYAKSFQIPPKIPLGVAGMSVEANALSAELNFKFKTAIPDERHRILLFTEIDSTTFNFDVKIDSTVYHFDYLSLKDVGNKKMVEIIYTGSITDIQVKTVGGNPTGAHFRFYGIDIEHLPNSGVVYHSLGVGAAPFRSVLYLDKMPDQASELKPDIVILDFGTNDILYHNKIDPKLPEQMRKAIRNFRAVNPEVLIVLTSTQDLFYKGKYITVGPAFRDLMDSIAREQNCLFWNWYDLSGGLGTIRTWYSSGYAQKDCIHLTQKGYQVKGEFLYSSFMNTLEKIHSDTLQNGLTIPLKVYESAIKIDTVTSTPAAPKPATKSKSYRVKSGDTLSQIAQRHHTTVAKIKKLNGLRSDMIRVGQILKIP